MNDIEARNYSLFGDQEGFYLQEAQEILRGNVAKVLTEAHIQAWNNANRRILTVDEPF